MDKKYTLVYSINNEPNPSTVYVNLTNACTNSCVFCLREQKDDVCGAEMWHDGNYTLDDIIAQFKEYIPTPQVIPIAALIHRVAAVVKPIIIGPFLRTAPAPIKPIPDTT